MHQGTLTPNRTRWLYRSDKEVQYEKNTLMKDNHGEIKNI